MSVINDRSRVVARAVVDRLGRQPGQHLYDNLRGGLVVITAVPAGHSRHTLANRGHLRLPAAIRRAAGITAGDTLLLAAAPDHHLALLCPTDIQALLLDSLLGHITEQP